MKSFLFTNTFFEEELVCDRILSIDDYLNKHPVYQQLQYLSFLTVDEDQTPLISIPPSKEHLNHLEQIGLNPDFELLSSKETKNGLLSSWGPSLSLTKWAFEKNQIYKIPSWDILKKIHSKEFAFQNFPQIENSTILTDSNSLTSWWASCLGPKVLKGLYGASGRGHFISEGTQDDIPKALSFLKRHEKAIAQPWVERIFDFSTQWLIKENKEHIYLGATICENSKKGSYHRSIVGPEEILFQNKMKFLSEHLIHAEKAIALLKSLSFFGNIGFDAFAYCDPLTKETKLFPIVEINARKTMGLAALRLHKKLGGDFLTAIQYGSSKDSGINLLPFSVEKTTFGKQLFLQRNPICI